MGTAPTPARFTQEQENLWKIYTNTLETLNLHLDRCLKEEVKIKLADYRILAAIIDSPQTDSTDAHPVVRMRDLARATNVSASRLTYQVDVLEKNGWVTKVSIPSDKRGKGVLITQQGRQVFREATPVYTREVQRTVFEGLDPDVARALAHFSRGVLGKVAYPERQRVRT
ncbi:MarR family winged helix-turn-helix transcriptional regulator [Rothia nasimurium]|uniref:MarR family winged helix-turn-helix transcriptional regulator n=1 Tax=Rothia nasimurium TaxID=85336 RepID=UPI001F2FF183|nr:MarR family winged helix-turn-helix transcriptional regulator [Rothia nasimurium]